MRYRSPALTVTRVLLLAVALLQSRAIAEVTRFEITKREPFVGGTAFGDVAVT